MDEKFKKYLLYGGIGLVALIFLITLMKRGSSSGGTVYTTGFSGNDAAAVATTGIAASAQEQEAYYAEQLGVAQASDQLAYGKNTNAANVTIAKSGDSAFASIEAQMIAAEQAVALNTNKTNEAIAAGNNQASEQIVANEGSTLIGLQPSWFDQIINGAGALNLQNQSGSFLGKVVQPLGSNPLSGSSNSPNGGGSGLGGILSLVGSLFG